MPSSKAQKIRLEKILITPIFSKIHRQSQGSFGFGSPCHILCIPRKSSGYENRQGLSFSSDIYATSTYLEHHLNFSMVVWRQKLRSCRTCARTLIYCVRSNFVLFWSKSKFFESHFGLWIIFYDVFNRVKQGFQWNEKSARIARSPFVAWRCCTFT